VSYALFLHPSAFIHPLWFNHSSFIITIILHQLDDIRLPTLNLPAINLLSRPMYFSFSRTFFFTPFPFSFFATILVALCVSICILRFPLFVFSAGEERFVFMFGE